MTRVAVFGSGFGLYGYLPALLADGHDVFVDERHRGRLAKRSDIRHLEARVSWVAGEAAQLAAAEAVVIARRPMDQVELVQRTLTYSNVRRLFLEKPVAPDPQMALGLLDSITGSGCIIRTGHNFHETAWGQRLRTIVKGAVDSCAGIQWQFRANHFVMDVQTWKRQHLQGGGALRFYGIHLVHLAALLGFSRVLRSEVRKNRSGEVQGWMATLAGQVGTLELLVDSNSPDHRFVVWEGMDHHHVADLGDPYDDTRAPSGYDRRVGVLRDMMRDFLAADRPFLEFDRLCLEIWQQIEELTPTLAGGDYRE